MLNTHWSAIIAAMAQAIITATKAEKVEKELTLSEKLQSTEWRFAEALVKNNFNQSKAAEEIFNIGKKGSKGKRNHQNVASNMGSRMFSNAKVKQYVSEIVLSSDHVNTNVIMERFGQIMKRDNLDIVDSQITLGMKLLEHQGVILPKTEQHIEDHRHVHLIIPQREDD